MTAQGRAERGRSTPHLRADGREVRLRGLDGGAGGLENGANWRAVVRSRSFMTSVVVLLVVAAVWTATLVAQAQPETLDQRVYHVASQLQCPICQGESAADSPSTLAQQMRAVIRERLQHGQSEQQVIQYFVSTYGEGIRESPPLSGFTLIMWLGPIVMLLVGIWLVATVARQWRGVPAPAGVGEDAALNDLSAEDEAHYRALLDAELRENRGKGAG